MPKQRINPDALITPRGYTHVVKSGKLVFIAGQTAADKKGEVVGASDIVAQTKQALANLDAAVKAAGGTREDIVSIVMYAVDTANRDHLSDIRQARIDFFGDKSPAATLVFVSGLAREGLLMEIEATAVIGE